MGSIQHLMGKALITICLESKNYTIHTIRHSFATHLIDNGTDLHTLKELLGDNSLQTTMKYLHLTSRRINGLVNPYDDIPERDNNNKPLLKNKK